MSTDDRRLRELWREREAGSAPSPSCPEPERIWRAVGLESSTGERQALVKHLTGCARCAETWRLAAGLADRSVPQTAAAAAERRWRTRPQLALAAASLVVAVGLGWLALRPGTDRGTAVRATGGDIRSLLQSGQALPRERFLLRWTPGLPGTIYDVEVATIDLKLLARGIALTEPEFLVPTEALAGLPSGTSIAWRVEAALPDGRSVASVTQFNRVR
jgi:hypothetical protein